MPMREVRKSRPPAGSPTGSAHLDELLDQALEETFPASDPVAIRFDQPRADLLGEEDSK